MNDQEILKQPKTLKNPKGSGPRKGSSRDAELASMRKGIETYVRAELARGHTPCEILMKYLSPPSSVLQP